MKKWVALFFIYFSVSIFSQTTVSPEFSELKGMEDQQANTHLFYRIYSSYSNDPFYSTNNDIYHFDLHNTEDTLFIADFSYDYPAYQIFQSVEDYDFWNDDFTKYIFCGSSGSWEPGPFIQRFDEGLINLNFLCCEVKHLDISSEDDSLLYAGGELWGEVTAHSIRSLNGGFNWNPVFDTLKFISLSTVSDDFMFFEDFSGNLYRSTDGANSYHVVDIMSEWGSSNSFIYDSDQLHIYRVFKDKTLRVSSNQGEAFSWGTKYTTDSKIFISVDEYFPGTIYLADKKNIFISTDYGNNFNLYKTLDRKIVGIYQKPNSNRLYAATKYKIYEITPDTIQIVKSLPIPEDIFAWLPLNLEDKWIYQNTFYGDLGDSMRWLSTFEVVDYKVVQNKVYSKILITEIPIDSSSPSGTYNQYFRVDSSDGKVYLAGIENDSLLFEELYMYLLAEVGDTIPVGNGIYLESELPFTIFGLDSRKKTFRHTLTPVQDIELVNGLGLIYEYIWELVGLKKVLKGCIVDGVVYGDTTVVSVDEEPTLVASSFKLEQNYPNPFNPTTKIKFTIPTPPVSSPLLKGRTKEGFITLKVYDILGNEIVTLVNEELSSGEYEVEFDASNLPSGIYFYQLKAGSFIQTKKMVLLK